MILNSDNGTQIIWLFIWTVNNICLTLLNKAAFVTVDFKYPYFLSFIQMLCNSIGSSIIFKFIKLHNAKKLANQSLPSLAISSSSTDNVNFPNTIDIYNSTTSSNNNYFHSVTTVVEKETGFFPSILGNITQKSITTKKDRITIYLFSVIFSLNIAIGNLSLRYVSVNFNQVMRSLVPAITIFMSLIVGKSVSKTRQLAVIPIVIGVAIAAYGNMSCTIVGFIVTVFCVLLAALKYVASGELLTGSLKLHPLDLLSHMAPSAMMQCLFLSICVGEYNDILRRWDTELNPLVNWYPAFIIFSSGILSFSLNICSLTANKMTSPLTLCITANVKQVMLIVINKIIFDIAISPLNDLGIALVLIGSAHYSLVCLGEDEARRKLAKDQGNSKEYSTIEVMDNLDHGCNDHDIAPLMDSASPFEDMTYNYVQDLSTLQY